MWAGIIHIAVKINLAIILLIDKNVNLCFITTDKYGIVPLHIIYTWSIDTCTEASVSLAIRKVLIVAAIGKCNLACRYCSCNTIFFI